MLWNTLPCSWVESSARMLSTTLLSPWLLRVGCSFCGLPTTLPSHLPFPLGHFPVVVQGHTLDQPEIWRKVVGVAVGLTSFFWSVTSCKNERWRVRWDSWLSTGRSGLGRPPGMSCVRRFSWRSGHVPYNWVGGQGIAP